MEAVVIVKSIAALDNILPLLFEFIHLIDEPLFIARDRELKNIILKNETLMEAIHELNGKLTSFNVTGNRYLNQIINLFILRRYLVKPIASFESPIEYRLLNFMTGFNRKVWKGKRFLNLIMNMPYRAAKSQKNYYKVVYHGQQPGE